MPDDAPRVFLSYSHDSDEHRDRVLALADRLCADGIDTHLDQYETSPAEGWPRWMRRQISDADFVLVVATSIYERRFEGEEEVGKGLGVRWEGASLTQELYEAGAKTTTFIPVIFGRQAAGHIPLILRPFTWYDLSTYDGYEQLYRRLTDQPKVVSPALGKRRTLPPRPPRSRAGSGIFMVPYHRNPYFTGREDVLDALHQTLRRDGLAALSQTEPSAAPQGTRTAISGLGGIGKTQTAVEYAYRHAGEYRAVFFVRADTEAELFDGYTRIARALDLPEATAGDQEVVVASVRRWLETEDGWLLAFDNADRPKIVKPFLPPRHRGHVLVTSRAQAFHAVGIRHPFHLESLPPDEALAFLLARAERKEAGAEEQRAAAELAAELAYLPLALEQAGAYVLEKQLRFASYLTAYREQGLELLDRSRPMVEGHPEAVTTTWAMNMRKVGEESPASADLLRACALLAPDDVPEEFLTEGAAELGSAIAVVPLEDDPLAVGALLAPLVRYSLVRRDLVGRTWSVHRLVQEVVKASLGEEERRRWVERVVRALDKAFPWPEFSTWPACGQLLPHVLALVGLTEVRMPEIEETGHLLNSAANYLRNRARYAEAEPLYERSLIILEKTLGDEHPTVAAALNNLATLYSDQRRLAEAELLYERSFKILEKALGDEHPDVANALNNLAILYRDQGRVAEAEPLYERSLKIREKALGKEHPAVAASLNNLAILYRDQGRVAEAEPLYERSLKIREKALGKEHPIVASSLNNLAILYRDQGRLTEAEPLYERSLKIFEKALGDQHPDIATTLHNLASLYADQGRAGEAEPLFERSLAIQEKAFGPEHPSVATSLDNLAKLYVDQGRYREAERIYQRSLVILENTSGKSHPRVIRILKNLAEISRRTGLKKGQGQDANEILTEAIRRCKESNNLTDAAPLFYERANLRAKMRLYDQARWDFKKALAVYRELGSLNRQGKIEIELADLEFRSGLFKDAVNHLKSGADHLSSAGNTKQAKQVLSLLRDIESEHGSLRESRHEPIQIEP